MRILPSTGMLSQKYFYSASYLVITVLSTIAILILEAFIFAWFSLSFNKPSNCSTESLRLDDPCNSYFSLKSTIPTYMALFIFAGVYQILVALWALSRKNIIQLFMLIVFAFAMLVYAGIQYDQIGDSALDVPHNHLLTTSQIRAFIIAIPCIIGFECLVLLALTWKLYHEYNDDVFKKLGPDKSNKRYLRDLLFFETIMLFDFFFFVGFTLQFVFIILETKDVEFGLTIAVIPITAIVLIVVVVCVYKEIRIVVYLFFVLCIAGLAYFIFKLVRIYTTKGRKHIQYLKAQKTLTVFAAITIVLLIITMIYTIKVLRNFGKGIKDQSKLFRAHEEYVKEINLGAPTDAPDNEMDDLSIQRTPSARSSIRTLSPIRSINSIDSEDNGPSKFNNIPNSTTRPVYSDSDSNHVSEYANSHTPNQPNTAIPHTNNINTNQAPNSSYQQNISSTEDPNDDRVRLNSHFNNSSSPPYTPAANTNSSHKDNNFDFSPRRPIGESPSSNLDATTYNTLV